MSISAANVNKNSDRDPKEKFKIRRIFVLLFTVLLFLSVYSHDAFDLRLIAGGQDGIPRNYIGNFGAYFSAYMFLFFGLAAYVAVGVMLTSAIRTIFPLPRHRGFFGALLLITFSCSLLLALEPQHFIGLTDKLGLGRSELPNSALSGGVIGQILVSPASELAPEGCLRLLIGSVGSAIMAWCLLALGVGLLYFCHYHEVVKKIFSQYRSHRAYIDSLPDDAPHETTTADSGEAQPNTSFRPGLFRTMHNALHDFYQRTADWDKNRKIKAAAEADNSIEEDTPSIAPPAVPPAPQAPTAPPVPPTPPAPPPPPVPPAPSVPPAPATFTPAPSTPPASVLNEKPLSKTAPDAAKIIEAPELQARKLEDGITKDAPQGVAFVHPPFSMLCKGVESTGESFELIEHARQKLQLTLESFKVDGQVSGYISGPRVTRYEVSLSPGVKVDKVTRIAGNIAMDLEAQRVRILAPIPGRNVVGVEVPNSKPEAVFLRSIMESTEWTQSTAEIPIALGKNVSGQPVVLDLARAPHLLIAGATGSGKSVCMNTLIMSLLFKFSPDELRLILVDPKVVELDAYRTLPQLITPVVNDAKKVPLALRWGVFEMDRRYKILAKAKVKNLKGYNSRPHSDIPILDDDNRPIPDKLPILVIILDELADVMMTEAKGDVETSIAKIAQKGRAAGIHIVIATQRPSREIITGVIRANLPTKIAFQVGSRIDSQVILDKPGAETLLGRGDMLFAPPGSSDFERIQGAMVADADIVKVVEFVSAQGVQCFNRQVISDGDSDDADDNDNAENDDNSIYSAANSDPLIAPYLEPDDDELVAKALEIILREKKASTSYLQRRLRIGYNRAAELIDLFEDRGIVGPPSAGGSKREILVFDEINNQQQQ